MSDTPATPSEKKAPLPRRPRHWAWTALSVGSLAALLLAISINFWGYDLLKSFVQSSAGERIASDSLGKAIKVFGKFSPLHLNDWTIQVDSFTSTGWPGEVIGGLDATNIRAEYDPSALWDGTWAYRIKGLQMDNAQITLIPPVDALKRKMPPKKPRPWYAIFLPNKFVCGPMVSPKTELTFTFQKEVAHLHDAHVQADLIVRDLQYTVTSGTLDFPYLPNLRVDYLKLLVTRPLITIYGLKLAAIDPADPARLSLSGTMGMRDNKEIDTTAEIVAMPIEQILPDDLQGLVHGRATGHVVWKRDHTGDKVYSEGEVDLSGASIDNLSVFKQLTMLHGNPDLEDFTFDQLTCKFHLEDNVFTANIIARVNGKFAITGTIKYGLKTKIADLDLAFSDLPLKIWLPTEFKPRIGGVATATLKWHGHLNTTKDATGSMTLDLDGTTINNPVLLRKALASKGLKVPDELYFKTAEIAVDYQENTFTLTKAQLELPGILTATVTGTLTAPNDVLDAEVTWEGLATQNWLPQLVSDQFSGDVQGKVKFHVERWKLADGTYGGNIELVNGQIRHTPVQYMLARFVNNRKLLQIPLTKASCSWSWSGQNLSVKDLEIRGGNDIGVEGNIDVIDRQLSGTLMVGARKEYLDTLFGLADDVFKQKRDGLYWAKVKLAGTLKEPKQDLSSQLIAKLPEHPDALFALTGKLTSWYLGNLIGADEEWKKQVTPQPK